MLYAACRWLLPCTQFCSYYCWIILQGEATEGSPTTNRNVASSQQWDETRQHTGTQRIPEGSPDLLTLFHLVEDPLTPKLKPWRMRVRWHSRKENFCCPHCPAMAVKLKWKEPWSLSCYQMSRTTGRGFLQLDRDGDVMIITRSYSKPHYNINHN